jgi:hypothetical protein
MIREALRCLESLTPAGLGVLALVLLSAVYAIQVVVVRLVFWFGRQLWPSSTTALRLPRAWETPEWAPWTPERGPDERGMGPESAP